MGMVSAIFSFEALNIIIALIVIYVGYFYFKYFTRENPLPGPLPYPLLGNMLELSTKDLNIYGHELHKKYGDIFEIWAGSKRWIWLARADLIELYVSGSTKAVFFNRTTDQNVLSELDLHGRGISMNNVPDSWRFNRKFLTQSIMSHKFLEKLMQEMQAAFSEAEKCWENIGTDKEIDFIKWAECLTAEIILRVTTGNPPYALAIYYNSLVPEDQKISVSTETLKKADLFLHGIMGWAQVVLYIMTTPKWMREWIPSIKSKAQMYLDSNKRINEELCELVRERRAQIEETPLDQPPGNDLLTLLLTTNTERDPDFISKGEFSRPLVDHEAAETLLEMTFAGIDTTANTISFIIYFLLHNPACKRRLLQEFDTVLGKDTTKPIKYDQLEKLEYCDAVIKETMRLVPAVPFNWKDTSDEAVIGGYKWGKNTTFLGFFHGIHMNKKHWDEPEKFNPDRFLDGNAIGKNTFLPFGGGPRMCPGRHLAIAELKVFLAHLFRKHEVRLVNPEAPLKYRFEVINKIGELPIYITPRVNLEIGRVSPKYVLKNFDLDSPTIPSYYR